MVSNDLLPLFLSEAAERLERLQVLLSGLEGEKDIRAARRELHTLKGASRMIGLTVVAKLCHEAEDVLVSDDAEAVIAGGSLVDQISQELAALSDSWPEKNRELEPQHQPHSLEASGGRDQLSTGDQRADQVRLPRRVLDRLSDECARLRVLSESAGGAVRRLDQLARLSERGTAGDEPRQVLAGLATSLRRIAIDTERSRRRFEELVDRQLETLLAFQIEPVGPFLQSLALHIEDLADSLGKRVDVRIEGSDCRLDRRIVEALREALIHLGRNAVDHGLEAEGERRELGKAARGLIVLRADASHDRFRFEVRDDGRGIDSDAVLDEAVRIGLVDEKKSRGFDPGATLQLLFRPGFSTRTIVGDVSGRGVGLDAVAATVRRVGGEVWVESELNSGTAFTLDLPVTRRGERVTVVEAAGFQIALPSAAIRGFEIVLEARPGAHPRALDLGKLLGGDLESSRVAIELEVSGRRFDLIVDRILGEEEVFVRAFPDAVGPVTLLEGMALLARGQAVGVLDISNLDTVQLDTAPPIGPVAQRVEKTRVLLVDDSQVTREMVRRMLIKESFSVVAVDSAAAALQLLQEAEVDCLVTDIDMPEMNGLALTREVRMRPSTANLPIVLISTAGGPQDRLAGLEAGADAFIVKQRLDQIELSKILSDLGGRPRAK